MDLMSLPEPTMQGVFVLSAPRTGSTLLRYVLDTHSRIASPGELCLARLCFELDWVLSRTTGAGLPPGPAADARIASQTRRIVAGIMEPYARSKGKDVWCDKTPDNLQHVDALDRAFPRAQYVCLHRHAMDVVKSMLSLSQYGFMKELAPYAARSPENLVAAMIDAWCEQTERILAFEAAHPGRTFRLRFEDMVASPAAALEPLFEFLGVGWEPLAVERAFEAPHDEGGGDPRIEFTRAIDPAAIGKGSIIPLSAIPLGSLAAMNARLVRLGYPPVGADWNERPWFSPAAEPAAHAAGGETVELSDYFLNTLPATLAARASDAGRAKASVKFVVEGDPREVFWIELREERLRVLAEDRPADCTLTLPRDVLLAITGKTLNPLDAFKKDKIRVHGPLPLAAHMMRFV